MVLQVTTNLALMLADPSVGSNPATLLAVFATSKSTLSSRSGNYPAKAQVGGSPKYPGGWPLELLWSRGNQSWSVVREVKTLELVQVPNIQGCGH